MKRQACGIQMRRSSYGLSSTGTRKYLMPDCGWCEGIGSVQTETICVIRRSVKERVDCAETRLQGKESTFKIRSRRHGIRLPKSWKAKNLLSQKEPPISDYANVLESHFGNRRTVWWRSL